jgi:hypothetical protein
MLAAITDVLASAWRREKERVVMKISLRAAANQVIMEV